MNELNGYDIEDADDAVRRMVAPQDPWLASAITTIQGWFRVLAATQPYPGYADGKRCIVGFYY